MVAEPQQFSQGSTPHGREYTDRVCEAKDDFRPAAELLRMGARKLIEAAIQAELSEFLGQFEQRKTSEGKRGVIRNGYQPEREILTGIGAVSVRIPKVRSRTGEAVTFRSALVPPYVRKTKSLEAALPWLYLKGI